MKWQYFSIAGVQEEWGRGGGGEFHDKLSNATSFLME